MRIDSSGNVGIGTSTPSVLLDVLGDGLIQRLRSTTSTAAYLRFDGTGTSFPFVGLLNGIGTFGNTDASPIRFMTNSSERMRITNTGNVGIGTNSPAVPLDVQCDTAAFGLQLRGRSADNISVLRFRNNAADTTYFQLDIRATSSNLNTVANVPMLFSTNNTERMRIDSSGSWSVLAQHSSSISRTGISASTPQDCRITGQKRHTPLYHLQSTGIRHCH